MMPKLFATLAALAFTFLLAMPGPAEARERADGLRNAEKMEFSSHRRRYRHVHRYRYHRHGYWGPRPYYAGYPYYRPWGSPYYGYGYYGPRVGVGIGPFGFGIW